MTAVSKHIPAPRDDDSNKFPTDWDAYLVGANPSLFEVAKRNRICGDACAHKRDCIIRRDSVYFCARCPGGKLIDAAADLAGDHLEIVYKFSGGRS